MKTEPLKKQNLIALKYSDNNCYTCVVDIDEVKDKGFNVDLKKGTWSGEYPDGDVYLYKKTYKIGESR